MSDPTTRQLSEVMRALGRRRSPRKAQASRRNAELARAARAAKRAERLTATTTRGGTQ